MTGERPRELWAHAIAADPTHWRRELGAHGYAIGSAHAALAVAVGAPDPDELAALVRARPRDALVIASEPRDCDVAALVRACAAADRAALPAMIFTLADPDALPDDDGAARLADDAPLAHLAPALAAEIATARARGPVWTVWVDDAPVAFAYAPWASARYFDVSVDVVPAMRQLGLATRVAAAMIRDERERGRERGREHAREPVWTADAGNHASRRLAERLGFAPIDTIYVVPATAAGAAAAAAAAEPERTP